MNAKLAVHVPKVGSPRAGRNPERKKRHHVGRLTEAKELLGGRHEDAMTGLNSWRDSVVAMIPALRAFAWSLCHNGADADDLVQDTLIKAWSNRDRFEPGTNLRAWLFTILRNTYYTQLNRRRREVRDEDGDYAKLLRSPPSQDWSLAMQDLQSALAQLPDEHREALILVGAAGLSYEEAAEICGCAIGTIKSRVNRARIKLQRLLDSEGETAPASDAATL